MMLRVRSCTSIDAQTYVAVHRSMLSKKLKDVKCISLRDAYDMIKEGKFNYYSNEELDVKVKNVGVDYFTDTKGYYQPVYVFNVDMNGEETQIDIPALKK